MTSHPPWVELDEPLARCPRAQCRRARMCCQVVAGPLCHRTHETRDAMYEQIADRLAAFTAECVARDAAAGIFRKPASPYERELRLKAFKEALEEREREYERTGK